MWKEFNAGGFEENTSKLFAVEVFKCLEILSVVTELKICQILGALAKLR